MHTFEDKGTSVPAFVAKLWKIVEDPSTDELIHWGDAGKSFKIKNQNRFSRELIPLYFKHSNMASFIRQLNMYGFHKIASIDSGGLKLDKDEMEFAHANFIRDHMYLLAHIKRKISNKIIEDDKKISIKHDVMNRVLTDVKGIKLKQDTFDAQLNKIKTENQCLWRELAKLRQQHMKQQQIINKVIHFLVQAVHTKGLNIVRHYPLMIKNIAHSNTSSQSSNEASSMGETSPTGPVIHEIDPSDFLEECILDDQLGNLEEIGLVTSPIDTRNETPLNTEIEGNEEDLLSTAEPSDLLPALYAAHKELEKTNSPSILSKRKVPKASKRSIIKSNILAKGTKTKKRPSSAQVKIKPIIETATNETEDPLKIVDSLNPITLEQIPEETISALSDVISQTDTSQPIFINSADLEPLEEVTVESDLGDPLGLNPSTSGISMDVPSNNMELVCAPSGNTNPTIDNSLLTADIDLQHVDKVENEIDYYKELLKGDGFSFDTNTLLGLFTDDPLPYTLSMMNDSNNDPKSTGNELMICNPDLDLNILFPGEDDNVNWTEESEANLDQMLKRTESNSLSEKPPPAKKRK